MSLVYVNGAFVASEDAHISVFDRGFLFGDGVYEVIPFYHGKAVGLEAHLDRLNNSLAAVNIAEPLTHEEWVSVFEKLLEPHQTSDAAIYLQVTRGAPTNRTHAFPQAKVQPTVFAYANPFQRQRTTDGIVAITAPDIRWKNRHIKSINLLPNCLAAQAAAEQGASETILLHNNHITEGSSSNVFIVQNGELKTVPASESILNGITRQLVIKIANQLGVTLLEWHFTREEMLEADEVWITSSTREIAPVVQIDKQQIGNGRPGRLWQTFNQQYMKLYTND